MPIITEKKVVNFNSLCFFQYYQSKGETSTSFHKINIEINNSTIFDFNTGNVNCKMAKGSLYYGLNPLTVYQQHFQLISKIGKYPLFNTGLLCYCSFDIVSSSCLINTIGPLFPGETFEFHLMLNPAIVGDYALPIFVRVVDQDQPESLCKVSSLLQAEQLVKKNCTKISYTILAENEKSCKFILYSMIWYYPTIFYVKLRKLSSWI